MIKIVKTNDKHLGHLVDIGKQHWIHENWIDTKYLKNTISKNGVHLTALVHNKIVGSVVAVEEDYPKFWLYYFAVHKAHQRKGVGTSLLKKAESKMKKGTWAFVDLEKSDKTGMILYEK